MEATFWLNSWDQGGSAISFHRPDIHPYVVRHLTPELLRGKRVLVPLCGKTNDLLWFRDYADHVVGIELAPKAVFQFFTEHELPYERISDSRYEAEGLTMLNMDLFDVTPRDVGPIDLVYDRAALVALPYPMRMRYLQHLDQLLPLGGEQFVNTLEYAPTMETPPFSISAEEISRYYGARYTIEHLEAQEQPEHRMVKKFGLSFLKEHGFMLRRVR